MKRKHTTLILTFSVIITIATVLLFLFFLRVIKNKNQHISTVITTLEEKMKEKEDTLMFAEKVTEIKSTQDTIVSHFVDPDKIDTFVGYLEDLGSSVGSELIVKNIEIPPKTKNIISIQLLISGTFQEVISAINLLENIPYQITVTQMYLNKDIKQSKQAGDINSEIPKTEVSEIPTWQADISFNILSLK